MVPLMVGCLLAAGCSEGGKELPLSVGRSWSYMVSTSFVKRAEEIKVLRRVPVGSSNGYELGGRMGISRVAWQKGVFVADQLPNASFSPPVPLVVAGSERARRDWRGSVSVLAKTYDGTATLVQEPETLEITATKKVRTTRATLTVLFGGKKVELITWYQMGQGVVNQEQRTNEKLDVSLEAISGD